MRGNELKQQEEGRKQVLGDITGGKGILSVLISQTGQRSPWKIKIRTDP